MNPIFSYLAKNKSTILKGFGIASMVVAVIDTAILSPKMVEDVKKKKEELGVDKLPKKEVIKTVAPYAALPIASVAIGATTILIGDRIDSKEAFATVTALALSESLAEERRELTREIVGEKKAKDIDEALARKHLENSERTSIVVTGNGQYLCYDSLTKQFFRATRNEVEKRINNCNADMINGEEIRLNDYCLSLNLDETELGEDLVWSVGTTGLINVNYTSILDSSTGEPCMVIEHTKLPRPRQHY